MPLKLGALLTAIGLTAAACSGGSEPSAAEDSVSGRISVFAAASLADAFAEMADAFGQAYPGARVQFSFAGTPTLRLQLEQGARADVFASADESQMAMAVESGLVSSPRIMTGNRLIVAVARESRDRVLTLGNLRRPGLRLVLAQPEVPAGAYARQILTALVADPAYGPGYDTAVLRNLVSLESNVRQILAKLELGEVDVGIVYVSDLRSEAARGLSAIEIPQRFNVDVVYPIAVTRESQNPEAARAFVDFVLSTEGQRILLKHGFSKGQD